MKKSWLLAVFLILALNSVLALECDFSDWGITVQPDNTFQLDGHTWEVEDDFSGDEFVRLIERINTEYATEILNITNQEFMDIAQSFFDRNKDAFGIQGNPTLEIPETQSNTYLSVYFITADSQYCEGIKVLNTFVGAAVLGEAAVTQLMFVWFADIPEDLDTEPVISSAAAAAAAGGAGDKTGEAKPAGGGGGGGAPELGILPMGEGKYKLVYDVPGEDGNSTYVDAKTGEVIGEENNIKPYLIYGAIAIFSIFLIFIVWQIYKKKSLIKTPNP